LILSDGEYYETRCLLLPNLNYLVNNFKLRKGSIIRLDRFELNVIPNGKILVIEELSVLKNTISNDDNNFNNNNNNNCTTDNERKSIMNNNLAETLKSIGIIGSLKPTSNNIQLKYKSPQIKNDTSNLNNTNTNNNKYKLIENKIKEILNSNESTDKNNNKNKFKKNKDDDADEDEEEEEEEEDDIDDDEEELNEEDDEYEDDDDDDDYDEEDELDFEENEEEDDEEDDSSLKSVVDIILCKCNSCKEQNTLKLCYKLLELDENSSLEQIKAKYIKLNNNKINSELVETIITNNNNDESDKNECNLDKLIRKLLRRKLFTITDSDRQEIRAKAYNLILSKQIF
jgi:hypothetical protein